MIRMRGLVVTLCLLACADTNPTSLEDPHRSAIDTRLRAALLSADATDQLEVVATFDGSATTGDALQGAIIDLGAGALGFTHLPLVAALATPAQIEQIRGLPGVRGVFLSGIEQEYNAEAITSVQADQAYGLKVDGLPVDGTGVGIAIIDTGVDATHPDLAWGTKTRQNVHTLGTTKDFYEFQGRDTLTGLKTPKELKKGAKLWIENVPNTDMSMNGHGTHVASTTAGSGAAAGGKYHGVAPGAHVIGINAATPAGFPQLLVLAAFDYIIEHRQDYNIQVVNNSWGSSGAYNPAEPIPVATKAVHDAGITVVFAAGNDGPDQNTMNRRSVAPWVISVAAACKKGDSPLWNPMCYRDYLPGSLLYYNNDDGRDHLLAYFSSRGIPGDPIQRPDVLAPGAYIVSARASNAVELTAVEASWRTPVRCPAPAEYPRYACVSGTSMAAPVVTGVAALLEHATGGRITPDQTLQILMSTATAMPRYETWEVGAGYVDARKAVEAALKLY